MENLQYCKARQDARVEKKVEDRKSLRETTHLVAICDLNFSRRNGYEMAKQRKGKILIIVYLLYHLFRPCKVYKD